jgi:hypothetical protein
VVTFQSVFHAEMHQNDIFFYFLKIIFKISTSKQFKKKKFSKKYFLKTQVGPRFQTLSLLWL